MNRLGLDTCSERLPLFYRYMLAIALSVAAVVLRLLLLPVGAGAKYTTFYPFVILAFYLGGNGPGITTIILTAISAFYLLLPPYNSFEFTSEALLQTALYVSAAGCCGYVVNRMHKFRKTTIEAEHSEKEIAAQELSFAVEGARLGIWKFFPSANIVTSSNRFTEHFGLPIGVGAVSYEKILSLIHPEDRDAVHKALVKALTEKTDFIVEHRVILPDGSVRWIYGHGRPSFSADGAPQRVDGITIDITERKLADLKYGTSLAKVKAAFDSMNEAILIGDTLGNLTEMNYAVPSFFRYKSNDTVFKTYKEFSDLFEISTLDGRLTGDKAHPYKLALQGIKRTYELKIRRKDTGETWYALTGTNPIFNEQK